MATGLRLMWSADLKPEDLNGKAPKAYHRARNGEDKAPGNYGMGIGGEAIVCLLDGDDGKWFRDMVKNAGGWMYGPGMEVTDYSKAQG